MRRMGRLHTLGGRVVIDVQHSVLLAQVVARHDRWNAWPRLPAFAMEHPVMPGADDVAVVGQIPVAERPAHMVAAAGDGAELTGAVADGNRNLVDDHLPKRFLL